MKRTKPILIIALLTITTIGFSQNSKPSIDEQFTSLIKESNNYQAFKIVPLHRLQELKTNTNDSLKSLQKELIQSKTTQNQHRQTVDSLSNQLKITQDNLAEVVAVKNQTKFLGMNFNQSTFQFIIITIAIFLLLLIAIFYMRFKSNITTTTSAVKKLKDVEAEFDQFRFSSLEREQKIRRQLQDEINKNKLER